MAQDLSKKLMQTMLEATILTGKASGEDVSILKIPLIPSNTQIDFKRLQFPLRLNFAMSINKAQGPTLEVVGFNLAGPAFSHGQLYVGRSRVGNLETLFIYAPNGKTKNIVYHEALQD
ncbi:uncharacterized protein LOC106883101 [Octopus bimaculoides]|uniref:ATP-dependent DNA helicase n=1 Tax=Octopus bimaculoides TaxID=37653 RepID=A0A0L8FIS7_OCTBM|nr:uncharacterized protein LOC106883101 [Octopus bimaculoides]|eukprot:XP_014789480.1 PREDICTED: uncharacterized protein LOC106883101 [Octopus bimaculoides]